MQTSQLNANPTGGPDMEPRIRHANEVPWNDVRVQDHAGRRVVLRERYMEYSPQCLTLHAKWDAGMIVRKHGHVSQQIIYVISGSMTLGGVLCEAGAHIVLDIGAAAGPMIAGEEGVELFEIMIGDPKSWSNDQTAFEALLREKGVVELEPPPLKLPEWMTPAK